jgi:hypothetical protein
MGMAGSLNNQAGARLVSQPPAPMRIAAADDCEWLAYP